MVRGPDPSCWLLRADERGNRASGLLGWTEGNDVRALVHGAPYFARLSQLLATTGRGDLVLFAGWAAEPDQRLTPAGPTVAEALCGAARRGAEVRGLLWRSHPRLLGYFGPRNRRLAELVDEAGGQVLLDQRVGLIGSHHQKFVVLRHRAPDADVAFVGGIDLAPSRRDDARHLGDPQTRRFAAVYGPTPAWHDVQLELRGPAVADVERTFRERWEDPSALTRLPWQRVADRARRRRDARRPLPAVRPAPAGGGTASVELLRTYAQRRPAYAFAPRGERSVARGYLKALSLARRLVYVEDQYLWSSEVAEAFAQALRRSPQLQLVAVAPRFPDHEGRLHAMASRFGRAQGFATVRAAGGDRVQVLDLENDDGTPIYVHAKVCIIDDAWAAVGSANLNRRSWTHDSELVAAVVDGERGFARNLRLELMREHLEVDGDDLADPGLAANRVRESAARLEAWHASGRQGERPPGRLRPHRPLSPARWQSRLAAPVYRGLFDPDGRR